jgi:hypothetical protein
MASTHTTRTPRNLARRFPAAAITLFLLVAGCARTTSNVPPPAAALPALVGAWRADVQFTGGAFAATKDLQFLYTFNSGGTMTESSNYDGVPPVPPAYGVWRETAANQFEAKYVFFTTRPPGDFKDLSGGGGWLPSGHGTLAERYTLAADGRTFESTVTLELFDMAGKPVAGGGEAHAHGERIAF